MPPQIQPGDIEVVSVGSTVVNGEVVGSPRFPFCVHCRRPHYTLSYPKFLCRGNADLETLIEQWILKGVRNYA